ncbi:hypothetical protein CYMTET_33290 [Cymbomonas tetramitiformis]|uniref:Uncharacterized protein n=1 Tax=Cymbomonas tetramitiformis TaxID=36881 RepID=A0AAE0FDF1_9CHLO|nr:hypothetical protein CYMTET_33290 [Cymbomonas tetramitiformis]
MQEECNAAATALSLSDTWNDAGDWGIYPKGCFFTKGINLKWNYGMGSTAPCAEASQCICKCSGTAAPTGRQTQQLMTSGASCSAANPVCETIYMQEECNAAATALSLSDTWNDAGDWGTHPKGCFFTKGINLKWNYGMGSTAPCAEASQCICKCSGTAAPTARPRQLMTSGASCSAANPVCETIYMQEECNAAATALSLSDTQNAEGNWGTHPKGCFFMNGINLKWNYGMGSTAPCAEASQCICKCSATAAPTGIASPWVPPSSAW